MPSPASSVACEDFVGPVLSAGAVTDAIVAAIRDLNEETLIVDRGSYVRVLVPGRCVLTSAAVEAHLGRAFRLPQDLELVMSALRGSLEISGHEAIWRSDDHARSSEGGS